MITLVAFFFLSCASALVWSFHSDFPTIQIILIQNLVSLICILPFSLRRGIAGLKTTSLSLHLGRDLFGVGNAFLFFLAIRSLNLVDATLLSYTAPIWVPVVWLFIQKRELAKHAWWSLFFGLLGVAAIFRPSQGIFATGVVYGFLAGICLALALVPIRMLNLRKEPVRRELFYYFFVGALVSAPFALFGWVAPTDEELLKTVGIGVLMAVGQSLLVFAYRDEKASILSPLCYSSIVYNGFISYFAFGRGFDWHSITGVILIVLGGVLAFFFQRKAVG